MSRISRWGIGVLAFALLAAPAQAAKKLKVTELARGSVADVKLLKEAPPGGAITDRKSLERLLKRWGVKAKVPVDFRKQIVLVVTTRGGRLGAPSATLSDKGDLRFFAISTRDLRPGFRYVLASVPRAGVKTINGTKPGG
jgi:hypothetical protein